MITIGAVPSIDVHKHLSRGDKHMENKKYDATYTIGNTICHVVAPPKCSEEELRMIDKEIQMAVWGIVEELKERGELHLLGGSTNV